MATKITLRDIDNRDGDTPYEFTGSAEQVCGYLDGPLRRDLTEPQDDALAEAMSAVRSGDLDTANAILRPMAVYLHSSKGI